MNFDIEALDGAIQTAPVVGYGPRVTYGKMTIAKIEVISWEGKKGEQRTMKARPLGKGEAVKEGEYIQISFNVDIQELNPALTFEYVRRVDVKKSSPDGKNKTDWSEIVEPALVKQIGKDWAKKLSKGVYVEVEDAETVQTDKAGKLKGFYKKVDGVATEEWLTNTAPKVTAVYKSKAECEAARATRFTKREDSEAEESGDIPANIVSDARGLLKAVDEDQAREIFEQNAPYNEYDVDELIAAAKKPPF